MAKQTPWMSARGCAYNTNYHLVWSVKYRLEVLVGDIAKTLSDLHASLALKHGFTLNAQEIFPGYVHLYITARPELAPGALAKTIKGVTAKRIFEKYPDLRKKLWEYHLLSHRDKNVSVLTLPNKAPDLFTGTDIGELSVGL